MKCIALLAAGMLAAANAGAEFPFVPPWDDASPGVTNMSGLLDKPAGSHGFVTPRDGHFFVNGKRIRFFGVNTVFGSNFPTHAEAEKVAPRMAKFGINCVRFHHMDMHAAPGGIWNADLRTFDPEQLDKLDYFIVQLKANGIYVDLNLHVSRTYPGMVKWEGAADFCKGIDNFYPPMVEMQHDYARDLLKHVNPYTKTAYADEPAIAIVEINNENGLICDWWGGRLDKMPNPYRAELEARWNRWLQAKYRSPDALQKAWHMEKQPLANGEQLGTVPVFTKSGFFSREIDAQRDWIGFLWETEENYWTGMERFLKDEIKTHSVIVGTATGFSPPSIQAKLDAVDGHAYWQHPHFPHKPWDGEDWTVNNVSMAGAPDGGTLPGLAMRRVAGKPYLCTEYNAPAPNSYTAEAFLLVNAFAAFQDWDGVFAFDYASRQGDWNSKRICSFFDIDQHPAKLVTLPAAVAMFVRGDVAKAATTTTVPVSQDQALEASRRGGSWWNAEALGAGKRAWLETLIQMDLGEPAAHSNTVKAPTEADREITWDSAHAVVTINSPRSKAFVGQGTGDPVTLGEVTVTPPRGWATITLTAMDGRDFKSPGRILIAAVAEVRNTGMQWKNDEKNSVGRNWGKAPALATGVAATIALPAPAERMKAWALDERGQRKQEIAVKPEASGGTIELGAEYQTLWYEVEVLK